MTTDQQAEYAEGSRGSLLGFVALYVLTPAAWWGLIGWLVSRAT